MFGGHSRRGGILQSAATCSRPGQFSCSYSLRDGAPVPSLSGPVPLYCPGKVQGPLSSVLQKARGQTSSDGPMTSGPVLQTAAVGRRKWGALAPHPGHFTASRQVGGPALPSSHPWSWLTCIPSTSTIWTLWLGEALALLFLSVACCHTGERWNKLS